MKISIRKGVFETNSSNTHTLTLFRKEDWDKYYNGENYRVNCDSTIVTREEGLQMMHKSIQEEIKDEKERDSGYFDVVKAEKEYSQIDVNDFEALREFIKKYGKCTFKVNLQTMDEYDEKRILERDIEEHKIGGKTYITECLYGRDG